MTGLAWNEMNINVRVTLRTNISQTAYISSHMTSTRLNSSKGVVDSARFVATSFGVLTSIMIWSRRERQWRKLSFCPLDERR